MAEVDTHTRATFTFSQLRRDPTFRQRFPNLRNVYVCVESDVLEDVRREATMHFPDGGEVACYFPGRQRFTFIRHAGRGLFLGEVLADAAGELTIGVVVDTLTKDPDWTDRSAEVATREVERQPLIG